MADETQPTQFEDSPRGWASRLAVELAHAKKTIEKWHIEGDKIDKRFRDERDATSSDTRWNIFTSNVITKHASLYGQPPKVSVSRRFADAKDDEARVAAQIAERALNTDIESDSDTYREALDYNLLDRLLPGLAMARLRYVPTFETVPAVPAIVDPLTGRELAPEVPETERKTDEAVEVDYVHWKDFLWGPARVWHEVSWVAFRVKMTKDALEERFGDVAKLVPLTTVRGDEERSATPWSRVDVWEIWHKETRQVFWYVEGFHQTLDIQADPLELERFFPCPKPWLALTTTSGMVPRPDFVLARDLYNEIDDLSARIRLLQDAVKAAGAYDKTNEGLKRLLSARGNELIPVDNWAMFAQTGGIKGAIDWMPLDQIVSAMLSLRDLRRENIEALHQIEGTADIMRGQATTPGATATEQRIKAGFGSVRLRKLQDEFACYASDIQKIKFEIMCKHFDPETFLRQSNAQYMFDAASAGRAVQLLKSQAATFRVEVKPESINLQDFAALKNERMEVLTGITGFIQAMAPLAQQMPGSTQYLLQILQWAVAGLRGASQIEGVLDQAIVAAQQAAQQPQAPPQPDPKLLTQQMKGAQDLQKIQAETQADLLREQAKVEADRQREANQAYYNVQEQLQRQQIANADRIPNPNTSFKGPG